MVAAFTLSRKGSLERFRPRRLLRPRSPLSCHPERSEGSAFRLSTLHAPSVSAFSSSDVCPFHFKLSTACPEHSRRFNFPPLTPFPATLTSHLQLAENKTTLSPAVATLTSRVKPKSFACHSYKKPRGWGYLLQAKIFSFGNLTTNYSPLSTISFIIRTYEKHTRNPFGIRTSKTRHLKPFRMNTYKKRGWGSLEDPRKRQNQLMATAALNTSWWARQDLNLGPTDYESAALTAELRAPRELTY